MTSLQGQPRLRRPILAAALAAAFAGAFAANLAHAADDTLDTADQQESLPAKILPAKIMPAPAPNASPQVDPVTGASYVSQPGKQPSTQSDPAFSKDGRPYKGYAAAAFEILGFQAALNRFDNAFEGPDYHVNIGTVQPQPAQQLGRGPGPVPHQPAGPPVPGLDLLQHRAQQRPGLLGIDGLQPWPAARCGKSPAKTRRRRATTRSPPASAAPSSAKRCTAWPTWCWSRATACRRAGAKRRRRASRRRWACNRRFASG